MTSPVFLHGGHVFNWSAWHPEPTLVAGVVVAVGLYCLRLRALAGLKERSHPRYYQVAAYFAGVALVFLALGSPLDVGAERLFSLHMLQHVLLSTWAPPLLLFGLTTPILAPILHWSSLASLLRVVTHPLVGAPAFIINMWFWHVPPIYDVAVTETSVHYVMHISFLATGLLFWWTLASPVKELHRLSTGWRLFYVFFTGFPMMILAFALVATPSVLYDYYEQQPRLWGISAQTDQQIGGAIMGTLGELTMLVPFTLLFIRLMSEEDDESESFSVPVPDSPPSRAATTARDNGRFNQPDANVRKTNK